MNITKQQITLLEVMIDAYTTVHVSGGSLHVVLEDGNWDIDSIKFCQQWAKDKNDPFGEIIASQLLLMPPELFEKIQEECVIGPTFDMWREMVEK